MRAHIHMRVCFRIKFVGRAPLSQLKSNGFQRSPIDQLKGQLRLTKNCYNLVIPWVWLRGHYPRLKVVGPQTNPNLLQSGNPLGLVAWTLSSAERANLASTCASRWKFSKIYVVISSARVRLWWLYWLVTMVGCYSLLLIVCWLAQFCCMVALPMKPADWPSWNLMVGSLLSFA